MLTVSIPPLRERREDIPSEAARLSGIERVSLQKIIKRIGAGSTEPKKQAAR